MPSVPVVRLVATILLCALPGSALPDDSWTGLTITGLTQRFPSEAIDLIARHAPPSTVVLQPGETLQDGVQRECGLQPGAYTRVLREQRERYADIGGLANQVGRTVTVEIPRCLQQPPIVVLSGLIQDRKGPFGIWKQQVTAEDPSTMAQQFENRVIASLDASEGRLGLNLPHGGITAGILPSYTQRRSSYELARRFEWSDYAREFAALNPGVDATRIPPNEFVRFPFAVPSSHAIIMPSDVADQIASLLASSSVQTDRFSVSVTPASSGPLRERTEPAFGALVSPVTATELRKFEETCDEGRGDQKWPFDTDLVRRVLKLNEAVRAAYNDNPRRTGERSRGTAVVLVADTGIAIPPGIAGELSLFPPAVRYQDRDGHTRWTANQPHRDYPLAMHGTMVASLALGGLDYLRTINPEESRHILLAPYRLSKITDVAGDRRVEYGIEALQRVIALPSSSEIVIVNLSMKYPRYDNGVDTIMNGLKYSAFYVFAAGNDRDEPRQSGVYPASIVGQDTENSIVVTAVTKSGRLAKFANRDPKRVEIAAPGCAVPTAFLDEASGRYLSKESSGTSFAAPLVTFAAAALAAESREGTPILLKSRIIDAADYNPQLRDAVVDEQQLNIPHTLSVFSDVVVQGQSTKFGMIDLFAEHQGIFPCDQAGIDFAKIRSIQRLPEATGQQFRVTYDLGEDQIGTQRAVKKCRSPQAYLKFRSIAVDGGTGALSIGKADTIVLTDIDKLVFASDSALREMAAE